MGNITNQKNRVTIYEVAKASNKSLATVSRVINNKSNVTEKTRKIVNDAIIRLNYRPSALAQGLAKNKSTNIGIVIPSTNYSYINNMLSGMVDIAKIYGYLTILFITKPVEEDNNKMTEKLITSHVDGAVISEDRAAVDAGFCVEPFQKLPVLHDFRSRELIQWRADDSNERIQLSQRICLLFPGVWCFQDYMVIQIAPCAGDHFHILVVQKITNLSLNLY